MDYTWRHSAGKLDDTVTNSRLPWLKQKAKIVLDSGQT
jgi:hypothetical protein